MLCQTNQSQNTSLTLEDAVEKLRARRNGMHLDEMGNVVEGPEHYGKGKRGKKSTLLEYVAVKTIDDCWLWQGMKATGGYGAIKFKGKHFKAHRVVYARVFGPLPEGKMICHHCDNPPCVNPFHMFLGDHLLNAQDMRAKGRARDVCGEDHHKAKLCEEQVRLIRKLSTGKHGEKERLGRLFKVNGGTIGRILRGKGWKHLT